MPLGDAPIGGRVDRRMPRPNHSHGMIWCKMAIWMATWASIVEATKHSFTAHRDSRTVIGPIGIPYGFLQGGVYNLTVFDFELTIRNPNKRKPKNNKKDTTAEEKEQEWEEEKVIETVEAGFLLKQFASENDFVKHIEVMQEDPNKCSFETFRDHTPHSDDTLTDDDWNQLSMADNSDTASTDGIFLSMKKASKTWKTKTPSASHTFTIDEEGLYFLIYQVCPTDTNQEGLLSIVLSTFELDLAYKNYDRFGNVSYLTAGEMPLPTLFFYFSVSYALCFAIWVMNIRGIKRGKKPIIGASSTSSRGSRPKVYPIHNLMSILLLFKTLSVFFESIRYHFIRFSGHAELWSFVYYTFTFLKGVFLFTVILLIGSGWSFVKPFLSNREKKVICLVLVLQVIDNIALIILSHETEGERLYDDWSAVLHLVDILCCCAVLVPIVWQVNALEKHMEDQGESPDEQPKSAESAKALSKLKVFRSFYLLVVAYIYFTRIVVFLFATLLGYRHTWLRFFVTELGTLTFYAVVGIKFRPMTENPYLQVKTDDDEQAAGGGDGQELVELTTSPPEDVI